MTANYKSVFDIIGPIMIGPSSSHTAGAVAIGKAANEIFKAVPTEARIHYYESFAETHRGHGTDYAIVSGILGFAPDDPRVPDAVSIAEQAGIKVTFIEEPGDSPIAHPNTAIIELRNDERQITVAGCSIGGGTIEIRALKMDDFDVKLNGLLPILLVEGKKGDHDQMKKLVGKLAQVNSEECFEQADKVLYEFDLENKMKHQALKQVTDDYQNVVYL